MQGRLVTTRTASRSNDLLCKGVDGKYTHRLAFHLDVGLLAEVFQQVAPFKVLVGMHNGFQLVGRHDAFILGLFDLGLMQVVKHAESS